MRRMMPARGESYSALLRELSSVSIEDLLKEGRFKEPICINTEDSVWQALETLSKYDILAAPVVEKDNGRQIYKGWIDMLMLCSFAAEVARSVAVSQNLPSLFTSST